MTMTESEIIDVFGKQDRGGVVLGDVLEDLGGLETAIDRVDQVGADLIGYRQLPKDRDIAARDRRMIVGRVDDLERPRQRRIMFRLCRS